MRLFLYAPNSAQYYSLRQRTTPFYKVLLRYYSVLQSTTLVLLCTTPLLQSPPVPQNMKVRVQYYLSTTTPYYTVLLCTTLYLKFFSAAQKVLLRYSLYYRYYSSTIPYYKVLLQYYSAIQSATPVLLRTTK